jgi:hypothetical protein
MTRSDTTSSRHRAAVAARRPDDHQLFTARLMGERVRLIPTHRADLGSRPQLHAILAEAAQVAGTGDPKLVRVATITAGSPPAVIRLHGPTRSLTLSAGRHCRTGPWPSTTPTRGTCYRRAKPKPAGCRPSICALTRSRCPS